MYRWIVVILALLLGLITNLSLRFIARSVSEEIEAHKLNKQLGLPLYKP